jgi:hypothetical protein
MSLVFRFVPLVEDERVSIDALWDLFRPTYPGNCVRDGLCVAFDFGYTKFTIDVAADGHSADLAVPLAFASDPKAVIRPLILGLVISERFRLRGINVGTGEILSMKTVFPGSAGQRSA